MLAWRHAFYTFMWFIWIIRNCIVFHQEDFSDHACLKLFCYHFTWWVKRALGDTASSIADISKCSGNVSSPPAKVAPLHCISCCPPLVGNIKVNMDGSFSLVTLKVVLGETFEMIRVTPFYILQNLSISFQLSKLRSLPLGRVSISLQCRIGPTRLSSFSNRTQLMLCFGFLNLPKHRGSIRTSLEKFWLNLTILSSG